jgi:threonine dehydrogenase-like Zn-dependent dehydrogenase
VDGALAQFVIMPIGNCFPLPDTLNAVEGTLLEPLGVAIYSGDLAYPTTGEIDTVSPGVEWDRRRETIGETLLAPGLC